MRCMNMYPDSRRLVSDVFRTDIDIDFVVKDAPLSEVKEAQAAFMKRICDHDLFVRFFERNSDMSFVVKNRSIPNKPHMFIVGLDVFYPGSGNSATAKKNKDAIIDLVLFHDKEKMSFHAYKKFFKSRFPILREIDNNCLYASCQWIFFDTVRMMIVYDDYLKVKT